MFHCSAISPEEVKATIRKHNRNHNHGTSSTTHPSFPLCEHKRNDWISIDRGQLRCIHADIGLANLPYVNHARIHRIRENHNAPNDLCPSIEPPTRYCDSICLEHAISTNTISNRVT